MSDERFFCICMNSFVVIASTQCVGQKCLMCSGSIVVVCFMHSFTLIVVVFMCLFHGRGKDEISKSRTQLLSLLVGVWLQHVMSVPHSAFDPLLCELCVTNV